MNKVFLRNKIKNIGIDRNKLNGNKFLLEELTRLIKGSNIGIYYSIKNEINIMDIINTNNNFYVPFINQDNIMEYRLYSKEEKIIKDKMNIPSSSGKKIDIDNLDTIIIPGIGFNKKGYRLGYGKGFYDKALEKYHGLKIGVCLDEAIIDYDFHEVHDIIVDYIITPTRVIEVNKNV